MKTNLTSRSSLLALLMAVLIFFHPFVILAQQESVEVQAKMAAERDAKANVNSLLWTGTGCLSVYLGGGVGTVIAASIIESGNWLENTEEGILGGVCVGGLVCGLFLWGAISYRSYPPPERLIGKSPEYIDVYTNVYKTRTRQLRRKYAVRGCGVVVMIGMIVSAIGIIEQ